MSSKSASELSNRLQRHVGRAQSARVAADRARTAGILNERDVDYMYEATFLSVVSAFEGFLEDLFFCALLGRSEISQAGPAVSFRSMTEARSVLLGEQRNGYLDWLPFDRSMERADRYLRSGRPFSRLRRQAADRNLIRTSHMTRNLIAHDSDSARGKFEAHAGKGRSAAAYLRQSIGKSTRHQDLTANLLRIGLALTATSDAKARALLLDEDAFRSGAMGPAGSYRCAKCSAIMKHTRPSQALPDCSNCPVNECPTCGRRHGSASYHRVHRH